MDKKNQEGGIKEKNIHGIPKKKAMKTTNSIIKKYSKVGIMMLERS